MCSSWLKVGLSEIEGEKMTDCLTKPQNMSTLPHCSKKHCHLLGLNFWVVNQHGKFFKLSIVACLPNDAESFPGIAKLGYF